MRILDIDLDFFVAPIAYSKSGKERLDPTQYVVDSVEEVRRFLEDQCGLDRESKVTGACFEEHDELFDHVRGLHDSGSLSSPIQLHHVDAHSDIGGGLTKCWVYVEQQLLHLPVEQRKAPKRGTAYLNPGNFIVFLAACRWLSGVCFVVPHEWSDDTQPMYMKDFWPGAPALQLKCYDPADIHSAGLTADLSRVRHTVEPEIPLVRVRRRSYRSTVKFDRVFLTRSPSYTPAVADELFDFIRQYIA